MNEDRAWQEFENTGKIDSYLKYAKLRQINNKFKEEVGNIEGDISEVIQSKGDSN